MSLPSDRIKQINLPNLSANGTVLGTTTYDIVPEMLGKNGFAAELPSLTKDSTLALTDDLTPKANDAVVVHKNGDTMTGQLIAQNNVAYTTAQVRNIILSTSEPTSSEGANGDIWIVYKE